MSPVSMQQETRVPLLDAADTAPLVPVTSAPDGSAVQMFERLARDPSVDVEKLERLIAMQERIMRHNAEAAFNVAFSLMQPQLPTVTEGSKTDKGSYAPREDIVDAVRPILGRHGFTIGFKTEWPDDSHVRVIGILTHNEGHARTSEFLSGADQTGSKNAIQALGSAVEYGRRYTTTDLLNIVTRKANGKPVDDDGKTAGAKVPEGFDNWWPDMELVAKEQGLTALSAAFVKSPEAIKRYVLATKRDEWAELKRTASKVAK